MLHVIRANAAVCVCFFFLPELKRVFHRFFLYFSFIINMGNNIIDVLHVKINRHTIRWHAEHLKTCTRGQSADAVCVAATVTVTVARLNFPGYIVRFG